MTPPCAPRGTQSIEPRSQIAFQSHQSCYLVQPSPIHICPSALHRRFAFFSIERTTFRLSDNDAPPPATDASENDFEIDWTKEPATERERRIRARWNQ
jgi:hypothetical protein